MQIKQIHPNFIMPAYGSDQAGAFDIYMPEQGAMYGNPIQVGLGFAAAVPAGHVALLLPRSGVGSKFGAELNNTCGVIDSDYRGEWIAVLRTKSGLRFSWEAGERLLQCLIVPVLRMSLEQVSDLSPTVRGTGGFGSTGQ